MGDSKRPQGSALEIHAAIEALSPAQFKGLLRYASYMTRSSYSHFQPMDLFQEAIVRTLDGRRPFDPSTGNLLQHLKGSMRSIANEWFKKIGHLMTFARPYVENGPIHSVEPSIEDLSASRLDRLRTYLRGDTVAVLVLMTVEEGHSPKEVQDILGINAKIYNAARKRIIRRLEEVIRHERKA